MRILFAGTPDIAVPVLDALSKKYDICGVLTNPDTVQGRKKTLQPPPVKIKAEELGLKVYQPEKLNNEFYSLIRGLNADILICFAYGKIFKKEFLELFPFGGLNIHPSLLPKYRGPSPISVAILNGDSISGITIQRLALKMDSGNILLQEEFCINKDDTTQSLTERVAHLSSDYMLQVMEDIVNSRVKERAQDDSKATFCKLIKKEDGLINWSLPGEQLVNQIRAFNPWPLAHTTFGDKNLNILEAEIALNVPEGEPGQVLEYSKQRGFLVKTGDGGIYITRLQLQSKKVLDYKSFNNGVQNFVGTKLG